MKKEIKNFSQIFAEVCADFHRNITYAVICVNWRINQR